MRKNPQAGHNNGTSALIRDWITQHAGCTMPEVADAIGQTRDTVGRHISRMVRCGWLIATVPPTRSTKCLGRYRIGQPVATGRQTQQPKARRAFQQPKESPKTGHHGHGMPEGGNASTDAYIAAGGHVERLASQWQEPVRYPAGNIWAGGRRGVSQ